MSDVRSTGPNKSAEPGNTVGSDDQAPEPRVSIPLPITEAIAAAEQHSQAGRLPEAEALCREILRAQPNCAPALHLLGIVTYQAGNLPSAIELVRRAIAADQTNPIFHSNLAELTTFAEGDVHLAAMDGLARDIASFPAVAQIQLHFALAKAYDDLGRYDEWFRHLAQGNALNRRQIAYDETQMHDTFERIQATFDRRLIDAKAGVGDRSPVPVFIVGMIRSGTTLIEQILASHPSVHGAGELPDFSRLVQQLRTGPADSIEYPECVPSLSAD